MAEKIRKEVDYNRQSAKGYNFMDIDEFIEDGNMMKEDKSLK